MGVEFNSTKDEINRPKHGVSLVRGAEVLLNLVGQIDDDRLDYDGARFNAFGLVKGRCSSAPIQCAATMRGQTYRLIPVRKASKQEQRRWRP
jgi:uncharacterized DUF497 family protein